MSNATFTVDTKLFRELGELLVGRESTALIELIKNAYDADATEVKVLGKHLADPSKGFIVVEDNGIGMDVAAFSRGFLRIAGRTKVEHERRSPWFHRRFTGEKGVGRLAAHKLAEVLQVESLRWDRRTPRDDLRGFKSSDGVAARIDWSAVEKLETLDEVETSGAVSVAHKRASSAWARAGTKLTLEPIRRAWSKADLSRFHDEVATLVPPEPLVNPLPTAVLARPLLLKTPKLRDEQRRTDFRIEFAGELAVADRDLPTLPESADWVIELRSDGKTLTTAVAPTARFLAETPDAESFRGTRPVPDDLTGLAFEARIFERHKSPWDRALRGVKVYFEGFRVLPYGDPRDDWLELDRDAKGRSGGRLSSLEDLNAPGLPGGNEREGLTVKGATQYFGGVFLTREGAANLKMLVNREGFLPSPAFDALRQAVRIGIDVCTRLRYLATTESKAERRDSAERQRRAAAKSSVRESPSSFIASEINRQVEEKLEEVVVAAVSANAPEVAAKIQELRGQFAESARLTQEAMSEAVMYRVLASVGLEQGAFVHEVNSLALVVQTIGQSLEALAADGMSRETALQLRRIASDANEVRDRLRRNAAYFADVAGVGGRRRRSRQLLRERVQIAIDFFAGAASRRNVDVRNGVPEELRTPPMFPSEVTAILSNLLSNAIKFSGEGGRVWVSGGEQSDEFVLRVENTGEPVDLGEAEKWFLPFRSSTMEVDEVLGQGMGLGLTISRSLVDEYGGTIRFVKPRSGFATAVEVRVPRK